MEPANITHLIDLWPTRKALADRIGAQVEAVHKWAAANRIPAKYQLGVVVAAQECGFMGVDEKWMLEQHSCAAPDSRRSVGSLDASRGGS